MSLTPIFNKSVGTQCFHTILRGDTGDRARRTDDRRGKESIEKVLPQLVDVDFGFLFQDVEQSPGPITEIRLVSEITDRFLRSTDDILQFRQFVT